MDVGHLKEEGYNYLWLDIQDQEREFVEDWNFQFLNHLNLEIREKIIRQDNTVIQEEDSFHIMEFS